ALLLRDSAHLVADYGKGKSCTGKLKEPSEKTKDRRQLEQDEHSTVDVRGAKGAKRAEKMYDNDEPSSSSHRRHASHSGALTSGKVKMIMAGLCGVLLVLLGKSWEGLGFPCGKETLDPSRST
ncbi:hypothetical protein GUITHDRAFT_122999, partial [Guillardia theta CCMP2712]